MKGLIFSEPMVTAWMAGTKTLTRKLMNPQPISIVGDMLQPNIWYAIYESYIISADNQIKPPYRPGERVYIRQLYPLPYGNGTYAAGDDGNIYHVAGEIPRKRKVRLSHNGYEELTLWYDNDHHYHRVNRLVCEAFYGKPLPHETETRHMDGNRRNNWPENLDWGTRQQNALDASAAGALNGDRKAQSKLSNEDITAIRSSNEKQDVLAKRYGVGQPAISKVRSHKRHTPLPPHPPRNHPEWAARSHALIVSVRPERIKEITEEEAKQEAPPMMIKILNPMTEHYATEPRREWFAHLWESLHPGSWERNDWVWRIEMVKQ